MPCILKINANKSGSYLGYCGKMIDLNTHYFHDVDSAYKGNKPICPKCRKALNLPKKVIEKNITSTDLRRKGLTIFFSDKTKKTFPFSFDFEKGYFISDYEDLEPKFIKSLSNTIHYFNLDQLIFHKKHTEFNSDELESLQKMIEIVSKNEKFEIKDDDMERLKGIEEKMKYFVLFEKILK